jgi:hypothetical protein
MHLAVYHVVRVYGGKIKVFKDNDSINTLYIMFVCCIYYILSEWATQLWWSFGISALNIYVVQHIEFGGLNWVKHPLKDNMNTYNSKIHAYKEQRRQVVLLSLISSWTVLYTLLSLKAGLDCPPLTHISADLTYTVAQSKPRHIHVNNEYSHC